MKIAYQAMIKESKDGMFVIFPDMEEAFTEGKTLEEALYNAVEVLNLTLEGRMEEGMVIPEPREHAGGIWVFPSAQVQSALLVRLSKSGRSLADLARALGTSWASAQRLENPRHSPTLKQLERAAAALGKRVVISFEPAEDSKGSSVA